MTDVPQSKQVQNATVAERAVASNGADRRRVCRASASAALALAVPALLLLAGCSSAATPTRAGMTVASVEQGAATQSLRIASYNIRHGRGMDERVDLERTAQVLRTLSPDIIALQEVDSVVARSESVAQADSLGAMLGMQPRFGRFFAYQGGAYGMAILSRFPIVSAHSIQLPDGNEPRIALRVDVLLPSADTVAIVGVHFDWVDNDTLRYAQAQLLARTLDTIARPVILLGDFNDLPASRTLALFRQRAQEAAKPATDRFSFSSVSPEKEIDYIFGMPSGRWVADSVRLITEPLASDHRPLFARLRLR